MIKYKVIRHHNREQFEKIVQEALADAWQLKDFYVDRGDMYQTLTKSNEVTSKRLEFDPAGLGTVSRGDIPQPHFKSDANV